MQPEFKTYQAQVLTPNYMITGVFTPRGDPFVFINDVNVNSFTIQVASLTPLRPDARTGEIAARDLIIPRAMAEVLIIGEYTVGEARPLPKTELLTCYTESYVIRGQIHMSPEVSGLDVFNALRGPFYAATDVEIFCLRQTMVDVSGVADLVFINGETIEAYSVDR